uniref:CAP-Gly domain-containing protein n=6 Tax=Parascaris univalens TaxID=6257 RepID=A0A914ZMJ9_PARUN
ESTIGLSISTMTTRVIHLIIRSAASQYPYEKRCPQTMRLSELKNKLQSIVGMTIETMRLELHDKDENLISALTDDCATLEELGICDGMQIYVSDSSGEIAPTLNDTMIEKYDITDEQYEQRSESIRAWKKRHGVDKKIVNLTSEYIENSKKIAEGIKVGSRCSVQLNNQPEKRGVVSYIGETKFRQGYWIGVTYDEPVGKNDGSIEGIRYFTCMEKYGGFVRPQDVRIGDFPPLICDREMEEI